MRHYSCDLCSKNLCGEELRYLVRVEGFPVVDLEDVSDEDVDSDSVEAMDELLTNLEKNENLSSQETVEMIPVCSSREYDLCRCCYMKLLSDPLGLESRRKIPMSRN